MRWACPKLCSLTLRLNSSSPDCSCTPKLPICVACLSSASVAASLAVTKLCTSYSRPCPPPCFFSLGSLGFPCRGFAPLGLLTGRTFSPWGVMGGLAFQGLFCILREPMLCQPFLDPFVVSRLGLCPRMVHTILASEASIPFSFCSCKFSIATEKTCRLLKLSK